MADPFTEKIPLLLDNNAINVGQMLTSELKDDLSVMNKIALWLQNNGHIGIG